MVLAQTNTSRLVGFVSVPEATTTLSRNGYSVQLGQKAEWLPLKMGDRLSVKQKPVVVTFGFESPKVVELNVTRVLSKEFLSGLSIQFSETDGAKPLIRKGEQIGLNDASLLLPQSRTTNVVGYSSGKTPALHWIAGRSVKHVSLKLLDENDEVVWPEGGKSFEWRAADEGANPASLYYRMSLMAKDGRDTPATLKFVIDGFKSKSYRIRIQPTNVQREFEASRTFALNAGSPWKVVEVLTGKKGYLHDRLYIEAIDHWKRNHQLRPMSQTQIVIGKFMAETINSPSLDAVVDKNADEQFIDKWLSDSVVLGPLWSFQKNK